MSALPGTEPIGVAEPRLLAGRSRQPTEVMIERPVLHHHYNNVIYPGIRW
jgi:hypothetical protein